MGCLQLDFVYSTFAKYMPEKTDFIMNVCWSVYFLLINLCNTSFVNPLKAVQIELKPTFESLLALIVLYSNKEEFKLFTDKINENLKQYLKELEFSSKDKGKIIVKCFLIIDKYHQKRSRKMLKKF